MRKLHVFKGEVDWLVARDVEDAWAVFAAHIGESVELAKEEYTQYWEQLDDDKMLYIWFDSPIEGVCLCDERKDEQSAAHEDYSRRVHALAQGCEMGSHIWCRMIREAKKVVPERKITCGPNGHYRGCPQGWPGKTCGQWADELGREAISSTEV